MKTWHQPSGLNQGLSMLVDANWSPDQALAVIELLDDLRERIRTHYDLAIQARLREQRTTGRSLDNLDDEDVPF